MDQYDGSANPYEQVDVFVTQVGLYTLNYATFYWFFPISLKGPTLS